MVRRPVRNEEIAQFNEHGFVVLRGMLDVGSLIPVRDAAIAALPSYQPSREVPREVWKRAAPVKAMIFETDLGAIAADLLGLDAVRLIHDALFTKTAASKPTPWHRDTDFWHFEGIGALTMWIPFQDTPAKMALSYVPGSHRARNRRQLRRYEKATVPVFKTVVHERVDFGDIAVHQAATLHASTPYHGGATRHALAVHCIDADARFRAPQSPYQESHNVMSAWDHLADGARFDESTAPTMYDRTAARFAAMAVPV